MAAAALVLVVGLSGAADLVGAGEFPILQTRANRHGQKQGDHEAEGNFQGGIQRGYVHGDDQDCADEQRAEGGDEDAVVVGDDPVAGGEAAEEGDGTGVAVGVGDPSAKEKAQDERAGEDHPDIQAMAGIVGVEKLGN